MTQEITAQSFDIVAQPPTHLDDDGDAIDSPNRDLKIGLGIAAVFFVGFLGWATFAPLDAAASAGGQLIVAGQRQTVQHRDGGVVQDLKVVEGQRVKKDQILIQLGGAEVMAEERALAIQLVNLEAQKARLEAEQMGAGSINWPASFSEPDNPLRPIILNAMQAQSREFAATRTLLSAQSQVLGQQVRQAQESATGFSSMMQSQAEQERLIDEELTSLKTVAEKGFVSTSRIRAMERAKADLQGRKSGYAANAAEARAEAGTNRLRGLEIQKASREKASEELRQVEAALSELAPKYRAAKDRAERLQIRSPATGTVVGLKVFTEGGVIGSGMPLMDVVPDRADIVIAARFSVEDADDLRIGQKAQIRFPGLRDTGLPLLEGTLTRFSADSLSDEKSGETYYTGELRVPPSELDKIQALRGEGFALRPGMPVEVVVPLRKRTALQYAFEPLTDAVWRAFREH